MKNLRLCSMQCRWYGTCANTCSTECRGLSIPEEEEESNDREDMIERMTY